MTCRRRHVKCDEETPRCIKCTKGNLSCVYRTSSIENTASEQDDSASGLEAVQISHSISEWGGLAPGPRIPQPDDTEGHVQVDSVPYIQQPATPEDPLNARQDEIAGSISVFPIQCIQSPQALSTYAATGFTHGSHDNFSLASGSSQPSYTVAISKWFDLLADDADLDRALGADHTDDYGIQEPRPIQPSGSLNDGFNTIRHHRTLSSTTSSPQLFERSFVALDDMKASEKRRWQAQEPLDLLPHEHAILQNFVQHISHWIDLFDPSQNFSTFVPHLAIRNTGLLKAILALSSRHMSLDADNNGGEASGRNRALQYYNDTLHYVSKSMQHDTYKTSLELLATALIISTYEMLDGSGRDWERHLQGVFWIQRSQVIHGDSKGLKQAVWWAWLCQDVWAAYTEKRKTFTFWKPQRTYADMNPYELAARSVFLMAQVINYCSKEEMEASSGDLSGRIQEANRLISMLEDWHQYLTTEFRPLPLHPEAQSTAFRAIWIHPPSFAVAVQLYNAAQLLLLLNRPSRGGLNEYIELAKLTQKCVADICGIAMTLNDYPSSIMSSQCVYIAGLCVQESKQQGTILDLLEASRARCGWPVKSLGIELQAIWNQNSD